MSIKSELQVLLKDSYAAINEMQKVTDMTVVKSELMRQSQQTIIKLKKLHTYMHKIVDSFDQRSKDMVDTITSCKLKTLDSHSDELGQCLEYLTKMCVITENLLKSQDDSPDILDFAPKLKEELSSGLKGCKQLNLIDYDMFTSLDLELDTSWLFKTHFLSIISQSSQSGSSKLCSLGFEDVEDEKSCKSQVFQKDMETDSGHDSPLHLADIPYGKEIKDKIDCHNQQSILSTIPEGLEEEASPAICKVEPIDDIENILKAELMANPTSFHVCINEENPAKVASSKIPHISAKDTALAPVVKNYVCADHSSASASVQVHGLCNADVKDPRFFNQRDEVINIDSLPDSAFEPNIDLNLVSEKSSSQKSVSIVTNKFTVDIADHGKIVDSDEFQILENTNILTEKSVAEESMNGVLLQATQITTGVGNMPETVVLQTKKSNIVPCSTEQDVNSSQLGTPVQGLEIDKGTCLLKDLNGHYEVAHCSKAWQLKGDKSGKSSNLKVNSKTNKEITENVKDDDQNQDLSACNKQRSLTCSQRFVKASFQKDILPQFSCGGPVDMPFNLESVITWNRDGVAEINAVCVNKITGGMSTYFNFPIGCCLMKNGRLVVADTGHHVVKILEENILQKTIGKNDGITFFRPSAVVTDSNDNIYVKDDNCVQIFSSEGKHLKNVGKKVFRHPYGIALTTLPLHGPALFVLDPKLGLPKLHRYLISEDRLQSCEYEPLVFHGTQHSKLRFFAVHNDKILASDLGASTIYLSNLDGQLLLTFNSTGYQDGEFFEPSGIAADAMGNWLVADSRNNRIQVFNNNLEFVATIMFSEPIRRPSGIHLSPDGTLYIVNYLDHCIKVYKLK
ncbi:tripartite motif-containing protein 3-like [Elysia marginata]|uniref:Tripartite motif-containing protein 3-like n=1 Tax=Elysia marginata TaxID=1093978 RepID=A0AAV4J206_9GAST|nr:tripartite motif-containing protein 3-like [Elysia marginata]